MREGGRAGEREEGRREGDGEREMLTEAVFQSDIVH